MQESDLIKNEGHLKDFFLSNGINLPSEFTLNALQDVIINYFVPLCRKCASSKFCKFHDPTEPPCIILEKVIKNYFKMNFKSLRKINSHYILEFVKSSINLIKIFNMFENWKGIYIDEDFNWYFESMHPFVNEHYGHQIMVQLSQYLDSYTSVDSGREKKVLIFLEGDSEYFSVPRIFHQLEVSSGTRLNVRYINLQGKDRAQKNKIKDNLTRLKDDEVEYFFILDKDAREIVAELVREGILDGDHYILWNLNYEDAFSEEVILRSLRKINPELFSQLNLKELQERNAKIKDIKKSIEELFRERGSPFDFNTIKVELAKKLSEDVVQEIENSQKVEGGIDGSIEPRCESCPEIEHKIIPMAKFIKKRFSDFFS